MSVNLTENLFFYTSNQYYSSLLEIDSLSMKKIMIKVLETLLFLGAFVLFQTVQTLLSNKKVFVIDLA